VANILRVCSTLGVLIALQGNVLAQEASDSTAQPSDENASAQGGLGEITVTARRSRERIQDVPVAVTAFSEEMLANRNIATLDQIAAFTPNIRFDGAAALSGGNYNTTVFIRGVGQNDFAIFSDPGVGVYVDDVYYARSIGGVLDAVDIEGVQVLRGPQGTLFGKNTVGGAVLITTASPDLTAFSGRVEATGGRFNRMDVKGAVNVPLVQDKLALRISAATINRDGYVERLVDGSDQGDRNADMVRAKLRWQATEDVTVDFGGDYTRAREHQAPNRILAIGNAPGLAGVPFLVNYNNFIAPTRGIIAPNGQPTLNPSFITADPFSTYSTSPNRNDLDLWGLQAVVQADVDSVQLKSISAYRHLEAFFARDGDNTPFTYRETTNDDAQWQLSQEFQLNGRAFNDLVTYVSGAYYFKERASDDATASLALGLAPPATPPPPSPSAFIFNRTNNYGWAVFSQADWAFTDKLSLTVGARYSKDDKEFRVRDVLQRNNVEYVNLLVQDSWSDFTPRLGINFKPNDDLLLYAVYSEGYKQGGFNGRPLVGPSEVTAYDPEKLVSYEAGLKATLFERRLSANLALFHSKYEDIQLTVNQTPTNFVANAAAAEIEGFELELMWRPVYWFSANAAVGNVDARYTEVGQGLGPTQILPITVNSKFVKTPEWTGNFGAEVIRPLASGELALRADASTYTRIFHDVANTRLVSDDGYTLVNARLTYRFPGKAFELSFFGNNLTDELYFVSGNASPGFGLAEVSYGRPREWGVTGSYRF
jgi:iron complex outermembrane recepter protein